MNVNKRPCNFEQAAKDIYIFETRICRVGLTLSMRSQSLTNLTRLRKTFTIHENVFAKYPNMTGILYTVQYCKFYDEFNLTLKHPSRKPFLLDAKAP